MTVLTDPLRRRNFVSLLLILLCICGARAQERKPITPDIAYKTPALQLTKQLPNISDWLNDDRYLEVRTKEGEKAPVTYIIDAKSGKEVGTQPPPVQWEKFTSLAPEGFDLSHPLLSTEDKGRHLYSKDNDLYLLDVKKKEFKRITNNTAEEKNPTFSPDGKYVAFTRENNLFAIDLATGKETQFTTDGSDVVYSGWAAWVYYEEILGRPSHYRAYWWSPDSRRIAFYRFDESDVPMFPIYNSRGQHGTLERTRYPEAGDPNPFVRVGVANVATGGVAWADFNEKDDQYFGTPTWTPSGDRLWVQWMNRAQNNLKMYSVDPVSGAKSEVYDEKQSSWVDWLDNVHFLADNSGYIISTDKDGWMHLYHYSMDGKLITQITTGKWQVSGVQYIDEKSKIIYFTARKETSTRTDLYRVRLDGTGLQRLTFGPYTHSVKVSPHAKYFITTYSNVSTPPKMALYNGDGRLVREIADTYKKDLDEYEIAKTDLITIPTPDGYNMPALITLPPHMEQNRKYPVLISIYGGPNAGTVSDGWRLSMQAQGLVAEGLIQFSVDHRASGHFGKEGTAFMYHDLGKWEMNDYIEAVKWLRKQPYVDPDRICITGGSYGGYITCMALTYGADYFPFGIAMFSVTDWKLYDTHYTERYMGTPKDNPDGYAFGSVLNHVDKYKGLLRIVHGSTDDNVHYQNSLQLIDTLENLGKHFEFMTYPNERHGWGPPKSDHLRKESIRFYYDHLIGKPFPDSLFVRAPRAERAMRGH